MDRPIEKEILRQAVWKRWLLFGTAALVAIYGISLLYKWIGPSVSAHRIRIGTVEKGLVQETLTATGLIIPETEQIIVSPVETRVLKILKRAGDSIRQNEPILMLDMETTLAALKKINDQLALKANQLAQLENTLENQLIRMESQRKVKELDMDFKRLKAEQNRQLLANFAISKNEYEQSLIELKSAETEYQELDDTRQNIRRSTDLQKEGLRLEINILKSEQQLLGQELRRVTTRSDRDGILTWVIQTEGVSVRKGENIARIADLTRYRVDATLSDIHASRLYVGMPVEIKIDASDGDQTIAGSVSNILPTIENGVVSVQARLQEASHPSLRANMRVDVQIIAARKEKALRLRRPVFASVTGKFEVFVVQQAGQAVKQEIGVGLSNPDYIEILSGLQEGQQVILSDLPDHKHRSQIKIIHQ